MSSFAMLYKIFFFVTCRLLRIHGAVLRTWVSGVWVSVAPAACICKMIGNWWSSKLMSHGNLWVSTVHLGFLNLSFFYVFFLCILTRKSSSFYLLSTLKVRLLRSMNYSWVSLSWHRLVLFSCLQLRGWNLSTRAVRAYLSSAFSRCLPEILLESVALVLAVFTA